jgi:hypothetical protein
MLLFCLTPNYMMIILIQTAGADRKHEVIIQKTALVSNFSKIIF